MWGVVYLTLPEQGRPISAAIRGGVGLTDLSLPAGAFGEVTIKGGLGGVTLRAAQEGAMRVEAKTGLGAIDLPESFIPLAGSKNAKPPSIWQTADFPAAAQSTVVRYSGGVGRFSLKHALKNAD